MPQMTEVDKKHVLNRWMKFMANTDYERILLARPLPPPNPLEFAKRKVDWFYDIETRTYQTTLGHTVSDREMAQMLSTLEARMEIEIQSLLVQIQNGSIPIDDWESRMRDWVKDSYTQMGVLAAGGLDQMTPKQYGRVGVEIRQQYKFIQDAADRARNDQLSPEYLAGVGDFLTSSQYAVFQNHHTQNIMDRHAYKEERRVAQSGACEDCLAEEARGWSSIGSLRKIGDTKCRNHCRCMKEYR